MKASNVRELNNEALVAKLADLKNEVFNLRLSHATGQLTNPLALANVKKGIARIKTVLHERETANKA